MSDPNIDAINEFYENEIALTRGQSLHVYTNGTRYTFTQVVSLRVITYPTERFLVIDCMAGKVIFNEWVGFGTDIAQNASDFVLKGEE